MWSKSGRDDTLLVLTWFRINTRDIEFKFHARDDGPPILLISTYKLTLSIADIIEGRITDINCNDLILDYDAYRINELKSLTESIILDEMKDFFRYLKEGGSIPNRILNEVLLKYLVYE